MAPALQQENAPASSAPPFRLDQKLHQILYKPEPRPVLEPLPEPVALPEPPYPVPSDSQASTKSEYPKLKAIRTWKAWGATYFESRWLNKGGRAKLPSLFTD